MYRLAATVVFAVTMSAACTPASTDTTDPADTTAPSTIAPTTTTQASTSTTVSTLPSTSTTEPTTTTTAQAATASTTTTLVGVDRLAIGLFCRDLNADGYTYGEAVAYWTREGQPNRMDADRNGIPCETVYLHNEVVAFWGEPLPTTSTNEFAFVVSIDLGPPAVIVADYAQWFVGDAATAACEEDGEDEYCPFEGYYYIRNVNPRLRTLAVSDDVVVFLGDWHGTYCPLASEEEMRAAGFDEHPTFGCQVPLEEMQRVLDEQHGASPEWHLMVWLITDGETVTATQEQYVP